MAILGGGMLAAVGEEDYMEVSFGQLGYLAGQFEGMSALDGKRGDGQFCFFFHVAKIYIMYARAKDRRL